MKVCVFGGDGIGPEVTRAAVRVLRAVCSRESIALDLEEHPFGSQSFRESGVAFPEASRQAASNADAVLCGAVGDPDFDHLPPMERPQRCLLDLRQLLDAWANLRPARMSEGLLDCSPMKAEYVRDLDLLVVRELLGGLYFGKPRERRGESPHQVALDTMVYKEEEIERIVRLGFQLAQGRRKQLCSVDKSNVLECSRLWEAVVARIAPEFPDVQLSHLYVDACATALVTHPAEFDVIVTSNLFGDILSDQSAGILGSLGVLPSASVGGPTALYEPVHGSAPPIAGKNIANPMAAILSAAMLLRHSGGHEDAALAIEQAVDQALAQGLRTADLLPRERRHEAVGTIEFTEAVLAALDVAV
ncbi:MAG: 3-isopropylmalate dehydrogenase [Planctomycetes bacterium]|nr:3-isopropylmalate dehydrogenase [Planctomycetota bacterium]MCB9910666.1 3-isopropylmalate dehydrogenase [Planctomycetota bacterium]